jgi:hypothetical protein
VQSFPFEEYRQSERDAQRQTILEHLRHDLELMEASKPSENLVGDLPMEEQGRRLLRLAHEYQSQRTFKFNRFEDLCILNILNAQHNLTKLDEEVHFQKPWNLETAKRVRKGIQIYILAIESLQKLSVLKPSDFRTSSLTSRALALEFHEPRYWESPDALNFCDLAPPKLDHPTDRLRLWLQYFIPTKPLDSAGRERREIDAMEVKYLKQKESPLRGTVDLEAGAAKDKVPVQSRLLRWLARERRHTMSDVWNSIGPKGEIPG